MEHHRLVEFVVNHCIVFVLPCNKQMAASATKRLPFIKWCVVVNCFLHICIENVDELYQTVHCVLFGLTDKKKHTLVLPVHLMTN